MSKRRGDDEEGGSMTPALVAGGLGLAVAGFLWKANADSQRAAAEREEELRERQEELEDRLREQQASRPAAGGAPSYGSSSGGGGLANTVNTVLGILGPVFGF